jgi:hypothetical protein
MSKIPQYSNYVGFYSTNCNSLTFRLLSSLPFKPITLHSTHLYRTPSGRAPTVDSSDWSTSLCRLAMANHRVDDRDCQSSIPSYFTPLTPLHPTASSQTCYRTGMHSYPILFEYSNFPRRSQIHDDAIVDSFVSLSPYPTPIPFPIRFTRSCISICHPHMSATSQSTNPTHPTPIRLLRFKFHRLHSIDSIYSTRDDDNNPKYSYRQGQQQFSIGITVASSPYRLLYY